MNVCGLINSIILVWFVFIQVISANAPVLRSRLSKNSDVNDCSKNQKHKWIDIQFENDVYVSDVFIVYDKHFFLFTFNVSFHCVIVYTTWNWKKYCKCILFYVFFALKPIWWIIFNFLFFFSFYFATVNNTQNDAWTMQNKSIITVVTKREKKKRKNFARREKKLGWRQQQQLRPHAYINSASLRKEKTLYWREELDSIATL